MLKRKLVRNSLLAVGTLALLASVGYVGWGRPTPGLTFSQVVALSSDGRPVLAAIGPGGQVYLRQPDRRGRPGPWSQPLPGAVQQVAGTIDARGGLRLFGIGL